MIGSPNTISDIQTESSEQTKAERVLREAQYEKRLEQVMQAAKKQRALPGLGDLVHSLRDILSHHGK